MVSKITFSLQDRLLWQRIGIALTMVAGSFSPVEAAPKPAPKKSPAVASKPKPSKANASKPKPVKPASPKSTLLIEQPFPSGAGVFVGEPLVVSAGENSEELAWFGAACSRWLQFHVGGQGELGKTPTWSEIEATRLSMKRKNLQIRSNDVARVTRALGLTHLLLGSVGEAKSAGQYVLKYQALDVSKTKVGLGGQIEIVRKALPVTIALQGTKSEIWKQLPVAGAALSRALGMAAPHLGAQSELSDDELNLLGKGFWGRMGPLSTAEMTTLGEVGAREPLAALLALEYTDKGTTQFNWQSTYFRREVGGYMFWDSPLKAKATTALLSSAPDNVQTYAEILQIDSRPLLAHKAQPAFVAFGEICRKYPYNYALQLSQKVAAAKSGEKTNGLELTTRLIRASPRNPEAWVLLASKFSSEAGQLRQGRVVSAISQSEWKTLNELYAQYEESAKLAVILDPDNAEAWFTLASAATFNSDNGGADRAFWRANELEPSNSTFLAWGLEQFQPKWGGDPESLEKVINLASQPEHQPYIGGDVYQLLNGFGMRDEANAVKDLARPTLEKAVADHPDDPLALYRLIEFKLGKDEPPVNEFARLVQLVPNSSLAYWLFGTKLMYVKREESITAMRKALELEPDNDLLHRDLGIALEASQHNQEALAELLPYSKRHPNEPLPYVNIAWAYFNLDDWENEVLAGEHLLKVMPSWEEIDFFLHFCDAQARTGRIDAALVSGKKAKEIALKLATTTNDPERAKYKMAWAHAIYAYALFKKGQLSEAENECQESLGMDGVNVAARYCLAEIYVARHRIPEAKLEWGKIIRDQSNQHGEPQDGSWYAARATERLKEFPDTVGGNL